MCLPVAQVVHCLPRDVNDSAAATELVTPSSCLPPSSQGGNVTAAYEPLGISGSDSEAMLATSVPSGPGGESWRAGWCPAGPAAA